MKSFKFPLLCFGIRDIPAHLNKFAYLVTAFNQKINFPVISVFPVIKFQTGIKNLSPFKFQKYVINGIFLFIF